MNKEMKVILPVIDSGTLTRGISESVSTGPDLALKKLLEEFRKRIEAKLALEQKKKDHPDPGIDEKSTKGKSRVRKKRIPG